MSEFQSNYPRESHVIESTYDLQRLVRVSHRGLGLAILFIVTTAISTLKPIFFGNWDIKSMSFLISSMSMVISAFWLALVISNWINKAQRLTDKVRQIPPRFPRIFLALACGFSVIVAFIPLILTLRSLSKQTGSGRGGSTPKVIHFAVASTASFALLFGPYPLGLDPWTKIVWGRWSTACLFDAIIVGSLIVFEINRNLANLIEPKSNN